MKQNAFIYCIGIAFICAGLGSCRAKKDLQRNETSSEIYARTESTIDSTRSEYNEFEQRNTLTDTSDDYYLRITEYDLDGAIRRISEKWGNRRSSQLDDRTRQGESVSVTGSETTKVERDSSYAVVEETKHIKTDSRPVQGIEWMWIVIGVVIVIAVILFLKRILKKR